LKVKGRANLGVSVGKCSTLNGDGVFGVRWDADGS